MANPIPVVASSSGDAASAPSGAIPVAAYGFHPEVDAIVAALISAGFGTAGQVLATNATADGFEWVAGA